MLRIIQSPSKYIQGANALASVGEYAKALADHPGAKGETIHNMPFSVTPESVLAAILTADKLGSARLQRA